MKFLFIYHRIDNPKRRFSQFRFILFFIHFAIVKIFKLSEFL